MENQSNKDKTENQSNDVRRYTSLSYGAYLTGGNHNNDVLWTGPPAIIRRGNTKPQNQNSSHLTDHLAEGQAINISADQGQCGSIASTNNNEITTVETDQNKKNPRRRYFQSAIRDMIRNRMGVEVVDFEFPGGAFRDSCRLILDNNQSVIATRRKSRNRAILEERVLYNLGQHGAPVPKILTFNGLVLIQEDVGKERLSNRIRSTQTPHEMEATLDAAITSLCKIHQIADYIGLEHSVSVIGTDREWLIGLMDQVAVLSEHFETECPMPELDNILDLLTIIEPRFVKWDARPGNTIVKEDNSLCWIDWEHCGARNPMDDLVWLLCDESVPDNPEIELQLILRHLMSFANGASFNEAYHYFTVMASLHSAVRIAIIFKKKGDLPWWSEERCQMLDQPGITKKQALTLCRRGGRWAGQSILTNALSPWFRDLEGLISEIS